jgi:dTDP-4-dehydrorhamnose 3,5-epimerase
MIFTPLELDGAYLIQPERHTDERGFFARVFCVEEFAEYNLPTEVKQANISYNRYSGTLRGMHYQLAPYAEAKLVSCTRGAIYDVIIDLRPNSLTFKRWIGVDLTADNRQLLFVPEGFAHGFQTLVDDSEVSYQMFALYHAESARGLRWDDSAFGIEWREGAGRYMSDRDRLFPDFEG